jgi:serine/threonine protein kinase
MNLSPPSSIKIDPDVVVGRGTFGTVYGCTVSDGTIPIVGKEVVTQDISSHLWAVNEVGVQQYVHATFGCAPYIARVDYGPEPVRRNSPNSFYRVVTIYQERLQTSLGAFIKHMIRNRFTSFSVTIDIIKVLLDRVAEEAKRFGETVSTPLVLHGDLTPDNVLLGMKLPHGRMSMSEVQEQVRTCRICIIDYGYSALYSPGLRTRLSACYTRLRYHHTFPVWYDRAFFSVHERGPDRAEHDLSRADDPALPETGLDIRRSLPRHGRRERRQGRLAVGRVMGAVLQGAGACPRKTTFGGLTAGGPDDQHPVREP